MTALWLLPVFVPFLRDPPLVAILAAPLGTVMLGFVVWRSRV